MANVHMLDGLPMVRRHLEVDIFQEAVARGALPSREAVLKLHTRAAAIGKFAMIICAKAILGRLAIPATLAGAEIFVALALSISTIDPAAAQFMDFFPFFGGAHRQSRHWSPWPWQQPESRVQQQPVDSSRAPPPRKPETPPTKTILVLGDSMADWLGYGLEDVLAESPDLGVIRKNRIPSGLIRQEGRQAYDWPQAAQEILATEKPDIVVMMIGVNDRQSIRERAPHPGTKQPPSRPAQQPGGPADGNSEASAAAPDPTQTPTSPEPAEPAQRPSPRPEPRSGPVVIHEFHSEKWGEAYEKRIDEMMGALKSRGVPVLWVALPAVRGSRASADMAYLNGLYRGHAEKTGVLYVDVWDGFVDENGNFANYGPDFEGQIRRLRSGDGVHFTKAGALKLAHYVEREVNRAMLNNGLPVAFPSEEPQPGAVQPGASAARPVAGPVVPLAPPALASEGLLGGDPARPPASLDAAANRVLVRGDPLPSMRGRADDFAWPRPEAPAAEPEPEPIQPQKPVADTFTQGGKGAPAQTKRAHGPAIATDPTRRSEARVTTPAWPAGSRRRSPTDQPLRPLGFIPFFR